MTERISWIAVDWGTSHLRAYAIGEKHRVIAEAQSTDGMAALQAGIEQCLVHYLPASI